MPPTAVRTIKGVIFWQYAKLIGRASGHSKDYGYIMSNFLKLRNNEISWSGTMREYRLDIARERSCIYCGNQEALSLDHLIPKSRGGPDKGDNVILACKSCNSSKGSKGVFEWYTLNRRNDIPRIVEGKYLKLLYDLHKNLGTLNTDKSNLEELCSICEIGYLCDEKKLTVYCLESILLNKRKNTKEK